jgi:hypothetical protein
LDKAIQYGLTEVIQILAQHLGKDTMVHWGTRGMTIRGVKRRRKWGAKNPCSHARKKRMRRFNHLSNSIQPP